VIAPPRPPGVDDRPDLEALDALIEEARRRARRRRLRNGGAGVLVAAAGVAAFIGFGGGLGGSTATVVHDRMPGLQGPTIGGDVLVTMRGFVVAARTLHSAAGPVHYREAGRFNVDWRIPGSELAKRGGTYRSSSASVTGTTSASFDSAPAKSCRGTLTVRRRPFLLRVVHGSYDAYLGSAPVGFDASPNPVATAGSATCAAGMLAGHWRLTPPRSKRVPRSSVVSRKRWVYNHPGGAFYGARFTPVPKGGDSEGWIAGWGPAGSFRWLAVFSVRRLTASAAPYRQVLQTYYTPIPGLFLKAVDPCTNNQFAACRRDDNAVKKGVERLTTALRRTSVPSKLAAGDRELRQGLAALDGALALRIRLAHQATIEAFIRADYDRVVPALDLMDKAAHDLDKADPHLHLRPV